MSDLTGYVFGFWTVIGLYEVTSHGDARWNCRCLCGTEKVVYGHSLRSGNTRSCGCVPQLMDMTGQVFGSITVLSFSHSRRTPSGQVKSYWTCRCACGVEKAIQGAALRNGYTVSCGCHKNAVAKASLTKHGHTSWRGQKSPTYESWRAMMARCYDKHSPGFVDYGKRGISVCEQWHDFANFLADMGERPDRHTLDRYPNQNGNYEPGNCRWATAKQQGRNKRNNRLLTFNGETHCISEWAELLGLSRAAIVNRIKCGLPISKVLMPRQHD